MKFGTQFEFHKIPEWYDMYLDYESLKTSIETYKDNQKKGKLMKLPGYYMMTPHKSIVALEIIKIENDDLTAPEYYKVEPTGGEINMETAEAHLNQNENKSQQNHSLFTPFKVGTLGGYLAPNLT